MLVFTLRVLDEGGATAELGVETATVDQMEVAVALLKRATDSLERGVMMKKYGTGEILPEPGDDQAKAEENFTEEDREELAEENDDGDDG